VYPVGISDEEKKDFPCFKSIEEWNARPGSKLAMLIKLLQHLLSDDNIRQPSVENGEVIFPSRPDVVQCCSRKILVYYEYPTSTSTIVSALQVHGIRPYVINGGIAAKKRDETVQDFIQSTDVDKRVLLFSRVGAAGLNLACAEVVILYVMSGQLVRGCY
jgi:SNF2 family DNA or RNA helicase